MEHDLTDPEARGLLEQGLAELGLSARAAQIEALLGFSALLERWAGRLNLTAHRDRRSLLVRLILDSAAILKALPPFQSLSDLGSGSGVPGIPIGILCPQARVLLVESRLRRHHFQRAAVRSLALERIEPRRGRIESLEPTPCDVVVARALARPEVALEGMVRWARPGGLLVIPGGEAAPDPLAGGRSTGAFDAVEALEGVRYALPIEGAPRTLWLGRRRNVLV